MTFLVVRGRGKENADGRRARDNARLILVFRPPKNSDPTPPPPDSGVRTLLP
jgi:hypothetical protein